MMRKAAVIGWPVAHSLSPKLHRYWLKRYHIDGAYEAIATPPDALATTVAELAAKGYRGFSVTVPHKQNIMALLNETDAVARAVGAVNTVAIENGRSRGFNTDSYGFTESIKQAGAGKARRIAVVLGAGGAARAVCHGLHAEGYKTVIIVNRTLDTAQALAEGYKDKARAEPWERRHAVLADADLLINATSLGLAGGAPLDLDLTLLPPMAAVMDLVYAPLETPLLAQARTRGHLAIDGLGMLIHQAAPAFEMWFGVRPEADEDTRRHVLAP